MSMWIQRGKRYSVLSAKLAILLLAVTAIVVSLVVFTVGHQSIFIKLEITLSVISGVLFLFLTIGLFSGVRIKREQINTNWTRIKADDFCDVASHCPDLPCPSFEMLGEGLAEFGLWIVLSIVGLVLLYLVANVLWGVIFVLSIFTYWIFYRALRQVFIKSRIAKGNLPISIGYGLIYTTLYTGWILGIVLLSKRIFG